MASVTVVSPLSVDQQAMRLREFVHERGHDLANQAAAAVCATLHLNRPTASATAARRIRDALAVHRIHLTYTVCLEALARLCGGPNWMRARQMLLSLDDQAPEPLVAPACFMLHTERYDGVRVMPVFTKTLADLAAHVLEQLESSWAEETSPAFCMLGVGRKVVCLDFEHPTQPWLCMKLWGFDSLPADGSEDPQLVDLPAEEVRRFVSKIERALEYRHRGLLVVGGTRADQLPPEYVFAPVLTVAETGFRLDCKSTLDSLFWIGACSPEFEQSTNGDFELKTREGEHVTVRPRWHSQESGAIASATMPKERFQALLNRLQRVCRHTGVGIAEFVAANVNGGVGAEMTHAVDLGTVQTKMKQQGMSPAELAEKCGQPLNLVLRLWKYGYAPLDALPAIAKALGCDDPNELLPQTAEPPTGVRLETGVSFVKALKDTHVWGRVVGDSIQGEEAERVNALAESLQEYVEVLQFSDSVARGHVRSDSLAPVDEGRVAGYVQELLDELSEMGVAVVVSRDIRFMNAQGGLAHMNGMAVHRGTVYFERVEHLQRPEKVA